MRRGMPWSGLRQLAAPVWSADVLRLGCLLLLLSTVGCFDWDGDDSRLRPIRDELPPTFWERHTMTVILYSAEALVLVGVVVWLFRKPQPPVAVPIEIETRRELEALQKLSRNGATLSNVARCLRRYFAVAFGFPPGELTTTEFCRALAGSEKIGAGLVERVTVFLQRCDVVKFDPAATIHLTDPVTEALELVAQSEARRQELRQIEAARPVA